MTTLLQTLLIIVCIALIVIILAQSGRSAGLSGAISGVSEQVMDKKKARGLDAVLRKLTVVFATLFIILSVVVSFVLQ